MLVCLVALFMGVSPALAQSASTGALAGTVTDPSGAVLVGANVTATNTGTGQVRSTTTDANGAYKLSLLQPGEYRMKFSAQGFKTVEVPSITVNVTETATVNHGLELGTQAEQITVESTAVTVQTENATVGGLVAGQTVTDLPLSTRNYTQVIDLSPGVTANVATATAVGNGTQDINVNGSGSDQNTYLMDGVVTTNYGSGGAAQSGSYAGIPIPNPDSIQEFKVQTSQYDAAYGQNPGANVNVVTKGGSNLFHGAVWEFNRNNMFNANDFFYKRSELSEGLPNKPPTVKQNQYGGTLGGPIKKDKLFFFGSYQGTRQLNGIGSNGFASGITSVGLLPFNEPGVPFASARSDQGAGYTVPVDFGLGGLGASPNSGSSCDASTYRKYLGCAFAGNFDLLSFAGLGTGTAVLQNGSNISQTFINLLQQKESIPQVKGGFNNGYYIPSLRYDANKLPFCADPASKIKINCAASSTISQPTIANEDQFMINTDYHLSSKHTLTEKYFFSKDPQTQSFSCILSGCDPGAPEDGHYGSQSAVVRLTSLLTNNLVNEATVSFQRLYLNVTDGVTVQSCAGDGTTAMNIIPAINNGVACPLSAAAAGNREDSLIPVVGAFVFPGSQWGSWEAGGNFFSATHSLQNTFITADQISWNHGKHSIRAGAGTQRIQWNWAQPDRERGWIVAGNTADLMTSSSGPVDGQLAAVPNAFFINLTYRLLPNGSTNPHHWRINEFSTFLQDDIRLARRLTLNLGLRWEYDGWPSDNAGVFTNFAASAAGLVNTGSFFLNNAGGTLAGYIVQSNYNKALYGNLTGQFGSTGILVNSNKTLLHGAPLDNFSPRIGLAWQAREKLVIRAGYGMFFDRVYGNLVGDNIVGNMPPYATGIGTSPSETLHNPFVHQDFLGFIPRTLHVTPGSAATGTLGITDFNGGNASGLLVSGDDPAMRTPKVQQYNLDVQYEFARGWVADIGYVGTHGIHLYDWNRDPNLAYLVAGAPNAPTDKTNMLMQRPASSFPMNDVANVNPATQVLMNTMGNYLGRVGYLGVNPGGLQQVKTDGSHLYNSLQAQLRHHFSHGLLLQASYTWSNLKTDINASEAGAGIATPGNVLSGSSVSNDPLNVRQQYGPAAFNRPQRFVLSYSYDLPFKSEGWKNKAVGGWSVSGVTTIQDGLPFTVTDSSGGGIYYGGGLPATGPYVRAELANPINCNALGNCQSGIPLNTSGSMASRAINGFINPKAFTSIPCIGGTVAGNCGGSGGGTGFGNSGIGIMRCCTQLNFDMAIIKNTKVGGLREDASLQFRAEFFNLFNHAQFNEPDNNVSSGTFGLISSSSVPGRILQFGLKYSF
jgi:Carboxypeptidase regulatory-like domain/TonB-dependent Receptor Plug Domain/TonB dependent receptor